MQLSNLGRVYKRDKRFCIADEMFTIGENGYIYRWTPSRTGYFLVGEQEWQDLPAAAKTQLLHWEEFAKQLP